MSEISGMLCGSPGEYYICFGDEDPCDATIECIYQYIIGCLEWTEIRNPVGYWAKVIITESELEICNGEWWACYNPTTGRFVLTLPDTCCAGCDCYECEEVLWEIGQTPKYVIATFSGTQTCNEDEFCGCAPDCPSAISGQFVLTQTQVCCVFQYEDDDIFIQWDAGESGFGCSLSATLKGIGETFGGGNEETCHTSFSNKCDDCPSPHHYCWCGGTGVITLPYAPE